MNSNVYIMIPFLVIAFALIIVGLVYIVMGTMEWISGEKQSTPLVVPTNSGTSNLEQEIKRLQEIATLERNARITSENK